MQWYENSIKEGIDPVAAAVIATSHGGNIGITQKRYHKILKELEGGTVDDTVDPKE